VTGLENLTFLPNFLDSCFLFTWIRKNAVFEIRGKNGRRCSFERSPTLVTCTAQVVTYAKEKSERDC
jgi:hypothetical protein